MTDIFDNPILCKNCNKPMKPALVSKNGFNLRALRCEKCGELVLHPVDKQEYDNFMELKRKEFNVKMRMVGNSYAVSIPREIVDFMHEQENMMNNMVKLCFEEAGRISLMFNNDESNNCQNTNNSNHPNANSRIVSAKEVQIVKNGKPILHARKVFDSAHPERNQTKVFKANKINNNSEENSEEQEEV